VPRVRKAPLAQTGPTGPQRAARDTGEGFDAVSRGAAAMYPQTYSEGGSPAGIAFDGTNLWVTNVSGNSVTCAGLPVPEPW